MEHSPALTPLSHQVRGTAHLPPSSLAQLCRYYPATPPQFHHLYRDADVEASTDGFTSGWASGSIGSVHEPKMGWGAGGLYIQV